jgi:hypothetical protein
MTTLGLAFWPQLSTKLNRFKKAPTSCCKSLAAVKTKPQPGKPVLSRVGIFTGCFCFSDRFAPGPSGFAGGLTEPPMA